jgi:hypothetical protein
MRTFVLAILITGFFASPTFASDMIAKAKKVFSEYTTLAKKYDPNIADLYSDSANIENTRIYPDGNKRTLKFPPLEYKKLLRSVMPIAKARGDFSTYSEVKYTEGKSNVTITATRFSVLKKYSSPVKIVVGPDTDDTWRILEEISESQP